METNKVMDTYILQKDMPDAKAGTKLTWDDNYGGYVYVDKNGSEDGCLMFARNVENNPEWFKKEEPKQLVVDKEREFKKVLKCLKNNRVMVDTREDGIYIRLAGKESEGEAFTLHFALAYPFQIQQAPTNAKPEEPLPIKVEYMDENSLVGYYRTKYYKLKDELLEAQKHAFKESRLAYASSIKQPFEGVYKHETVEDYIKSLNK